MKCIICSKKLTGKQTKFCSRKCQSKQGNFNHQSYLKQKERGITRKLHLLSLSGNKCITCGYNKNLAALVFHHIKPNEKKFELDMRSLSNRKLSAVMIEFAKCKLLCHNCHSEHHYPDLDLDKIISFS